MVASILSGATGTAGEVLPVSGPQAGGYQGTGLQTGIMHLQVTAQVSKLYSLYSEWLFYGTNTLIKCLYICTIVSLLEEQSFKRGATYIYLKDCTINICIFYYNVLDV